MTSRALLRSPALWLLAAALVASAAPGLFLLNRGTPGEGWWRLWTGHLVHRTAAHFVFDVSVAMLLMTQVRRPAPWLLLAPWVGWGAMRLRPELTSYAGLSGVLHGVLVIACYERLREAPRLWRWVGGAVLLGLLVKVAGETVAGVAWMGTYDMGGPVVHEAHLLGLIGGSFIVAATHRSLLARPASRSRALCGGTERQLPSRTPQ